MISEKKTSLVFQATNFHSDECGEPPAVTSGRQHYCGYFENLYREQWVFVYDREAKRGILRGGDAGWEREFEVIDGGVPELVLGKEESLWLAACWAAASTRP